MISINQKNQGSKNAFLLVITLIIVAIIAFSLGFNYGDILGQEKGKALVSPSGELNLALFWETYHTLKENYVDPEKLDSKKIIYGAISGMVNSLGDPYTIFLNPDDAEIFEENIKGEFQGVGMEISMKNGQLIVIAPLDGTPAQKAGIRSGDKIIKINDLIASDLSIDQAVKHIRGPKGTEVSLTIFREEWNETKEIKIIRDVITVPSISWELKENNIAYIKIHHFTGNADTHFRKAAWEILDSPAEKIVLDLRNNPGGFLNVAQEISGWFLKTGDIVVIEDFRDDNMEPKEYGAPGPARFSSYPIVILINEGSASASEILAGALRDNRGIKLIGTKSFGKGTVQEVKTLTEGSLKVTIANWLTPSGKLITNEGLEPDINIEISLEDFEQERDPQLDKAIEILNNL